MSDFVNRLREGLETCGVDRCRVRDVASGCMCATAAAEIERLRAALLPLVAECIEHCGDNCECYYKTPESCPTWQARAALEDRT